MPKRNTTNPREAGGREKAREGALKETRRPYGEGSIMRMEGAVFIRLPAISAGSARLDEAIGIGGPPSGRVTETCCPEPAAPSMALAS
ncbi:MAG TPA: hypothetical protein P5532_12890 [Planctomycetota bacterium]|nr:hypothetical protein [Planctomycetota bacterium]HRT95317.1 hypothetical protein [Planctomycetota bacterium]